MAPAAALAGSQIVGLGMVRYVLKLEPLDLNLSLARVEKIRREHAEGGQA